MYAVATCVYCDFEPEQNYTRVFLQFKKNWHYRILMLTCMYVNIGKTETSEIRILLHIH